MMMMSHYYHPYCTKADVYDFYTFRKFYLTPFMKEVRIRTHYAVSGGTQVIPCCQTHAIEHAINTDYNGTFCYTRHDADEFRSKGEMEMLFNQQYTLVRGMGGGNRTD